MIEETRLASLVSLIHRSLEGTSSWKVFLDEVRRLAPGGQALLFHHDTAAESGAFSLTSGSDESLAVAYQEHYSTRNPWMSHAAVRPLGRVVQADEMLPRNELIKTEYYNEFLKPQDVQTGFGVTLRRDGSCNFLFSVVGADMEEQDARQLRAALQHLVPHLGQAFEYYRRHRAPTILGGHLGHLAVPARARGILQVGPGARIRFADDEACRMVARSGSLSINAAGRLVCLYSEIAEFIAAELSMWNGPGLPSARIFHARREGGALPLRVTVFGHRNTGAAFFRGPECTLLLEDPEDAIEAAAEEFATMHGLSRAERRVVAELAGGFSVDEAAERTGLSINTVRTQLKAVFAKTNLKRQSELVRHVCVMAGASRAGAANRGH